MNHREPPAPATWMLDNLRSRGTDEALSGDLLEAFRAGRSAGWYWYQVIVAIAIAWAGRLALPRHIVFCRSMVGLLPRLVAAPSALQFGQPRWRYLADSLAMVVYLCMCICYGDCHALHLAGSCCLSDLHLLAFGKCLFRSVWKGFLWGLVAYALAQACSSRSVSTIRSRLATQSTGEASRCLV